MAKPPVVLQYEVSVTADDIANGKRADTRFCPVAPAFKRVVDLDCEDVRVRTFGVEFYRGKARFLSRHPGEVARFITDFDLDDVRGEPFTFTATAVEDLK